LSRPHTDRFKQTDLIPSCNPFSWYRRCDYPLFGSTDTFNALANIIESERSVDVHCRIAKTAAFDGEGKIAEIEWNKAIELAEVTGKEDRLQDLYYQFIQSLTDIRLLWCEPVVLQLAKKYLALDSSDARMHACLALARFRHLGDNNGAIDEYRTALSLEPRDNSILIALISVLWDQRDMKGILELFENRDSDITSYRIRACMDRDSYHDLLALAARDLGKIEYLVKCYETAISRPWTEPPIGKEYDDREEELWETLGEAFGRLNRKEHYSKGTALLTCRLADLHSRYRGDSGAALNLWTAVFLEQSEIFGLAELHSGYRMDTIPMLVDMFAELLYEDALKSDGFVNEESLRSLERLRNRHDWFREQDRYGASLTNQRNLNLFLAKLYRQTGRDAEAKELLREQFERGIELLNDDVDWNDTSGYHVLSKILFTCGQKEDAAIAQSLRRYTRYQPEEDEIVDGSDTSVNILSTSGRERESTEESQVPSEEDGDEDGDEEEFPTGIVERPGRRGSGFVCSMLYDCPDSSTLTTNSPFFVCMTCVKVQFCEGCYARHTSGVGESTATSADQPCAEKNKHISICSSRHEHIKVPIDGWRLTEDVMTIAGKEIPVRRWLETLHL
jgi:tetratricopeptide (TPR) repeat protein